MAIIQFKKQPGNYTDFWYKEEINLKRNKWETRTPITWGKDLGVETENQPKSGLARMQVAQAAWSPPPRPYRAASPSTPHDKQPVSGLTILDATCRNPHLSGHILICRVLLHWVGWQVVETCPDMRASRGICIPTGGELCPRNPLVLSVDWGGGGDTVPITLQGEGKIRLDFLGLLQKHL